MKRLGHLLRVLLLEQELMRLEVGEGVEGCRWLSQQVSLELHGLPVALGLLRSVILNRFLL